MGERYYLGLHGHGETRDRLVGAIRQGRFPQSLLLHGPRGVGKQRLALWAAAALQCRGEGVEVPCGECLACRLSGRLEHPDIHWFFPLPRPRKASSAEKLQEQLEDLRGATLEERRGDPCYLDQQEGATGIYVGVVHVMRRQAQSTPAMGPRKVLIIGKADALVSQRGSPEAANALLKLLEEPPADTYMILTSDRPGALLPTIRSRVQSIRVPPLSTDDVAAFLSAHRDLEDEEVRNLAHRSGGSIGTALELDDESHGELRDAAVELVRSVLDGKPATRFAAAHERGVAGARGAFSRLLDHAADIMRDVLATILGAPEAAVSQETVQTLIRGRAVSPGHLLHALDALEDARELASRNVNPQLITADFLRSCADHPRPQNGDDRQRRMGASEG